ncbi:MAG: branched-chain amino acid ABC transporter permease [Pseudomonadota bacterium]
MLIFIEQVLNGLNYGLLLFMIAAGLSLVFGVMHLINLAHGSLFMIGAFVTVGATQWTGSFWLGVICGAATAFVTGLAIERIIVRPLYARDHLDQVLATFGLILFFNELLRWISGGAPLFVPTPQGLSGAAEISEGFYYSRYRIVVTAAALMMAICLWLVLTRTKIGMLIRASANNPEMVGHIGYDVRTVGTLVFGVGAALAGIAGALNGPLVSIEVGMGEQVLILAFVIVVIGGMGSIQGTFYASILIGFVDTMGRAYTPIILSGLFETRTVASVSPAISAIIIYIVMAAVLIARPSGLFSK